MGMQRKKHAEVIHENTKRPTEEDELMLQLEQLFQKHQEFVATFKTSIEDILIKVQQRHNNRHEA